MRYFSTDEIAEMYNLKPVTIRNWINSGKLRAVKLGHLWRIPEDALNEFVKLMPGQSKNNREG